MTPWVTRLIIANGIIFVLSRINPAVVDNLILVPAFIASRPWTAVTYMFLHAGFGHIFFNMLALFFFGPRLEMVLGGTRFLSLYFISGIMGAGLSFFFTPNTAILGASGAVYGVMFGFAHYWPKELLYVWGVFPVQARWLVATMTALSLLGGFGMGGEGIAHFAHLGGFVGGFLYLRWADSTSHAAQYQRKMDVTVAGEADFAKWAKIDREKLHVVNREELDRIRTKIGSDGVTSLTPQERAFMDRFSTIE
ncbi:MAG: rhomboid family intramembrane serine protease [Ignavibacteriae bacterium]|nr:rhomboid family intramembrane serine protease [Ignavibacteria bacterium]MBI3364640.1 rhomboid family intramembrane serine protease [Ignavibacteriota bacterium]